jgi:hypothetical protein
MNMDVAALHWARSGRCSDLLATLLTGMTRANLTWFHRILSTFDRGCCPRRQPLIRGRHLAEPSGLPQSRLCRGECRGKRLLFPLHPLVQLLICTHVGVTVHFRLRRSDLRTLAASILDSERAHPTLKFLRGLLQGASWPGAVDVLRWQKGRSEEHMPCAASQVSKTLGHPSTTYAKGPQIV